VRQRTEDQWLDAAQRLRHAADKVLPEPRPACLPGELRECGQDARQHVLEWAAELKAAAQHLIEESAATPDEEARFAGALYGERLKALGASTPQTV
jgi:hypothetical protein